jgi:hypothetical protein
MQVLQTACEDSLKCDVQCDAQSPHSQLQQNKFSYKGFQFFPLARIIHESEITMLSREEELTPTASLSSIALQSNLRMQESFSDTETQFVVVQSVNEDRKINAAEARIIKDKSDVNQLVQCKQRWALKKHHCSCANQIDSDAFWPNEGHPFLYINLSKCLHVNEQMIFLFSQTYSAAGRGQALCTPVHGAGIRPNTMDHLTQTDCVKCSL